MLKNSIIPPNSDTANPSKNPNNWQAVHQKRINNLQDRIAKRKSSESANSSTIEKKAHSLYLGANRLNKFIKNYDNYRTLGSVISTPLATNHSTNENYQWKKNEGFMSGKAVYSTSSNPEEFFIFKNPGESRYPQPENSTYVHKAPKIKSQKTQIGKIFNIDYSRGFLETYSIAEILMPDNIPEFGISIRLKYPDQFAIATKFVKNAKEFNQEALKDHATEYKRIKLIGSAIGFDDSTYFNILLDENSVIKIVDGINPMSTNKERRSCFGLLNRNFFDYRSFSGGAPPGKEKQAEENLKNTIENNPALKLSLKDVNYLINLIESKKIEIEKLFEVISREYRDYVKENTGQLEYIASELKDKDPEYSISMRDLGLIEERYKNKNKSKPAKSPQTNEHQKLQKEISLQTSPFFK